ncbi:hypothetical protein K2173_024082 [Erythroxylum novogranatense]|uniref:SBP-type domain-containing protein n=1 Tax=Erythroxylum novogranatense TaxID=1862640 RepID=A0AAV8UEQ3_9ROSI|nr:hypothetical protein K2173_024082 [Erythroxylum novogranatense]
MEMGSGALVDSGSSNAPSPPNESVNGLKFGQKIYFKDAGIGSAAKSAAGSSSGSAPARRLQGSQQQPPRCQVEGCKVDLSDVKAYYSRHKVCGMHSKSPKVIVAGLEQRFCQQCSRFHQLPEFDQGKRSCRRRLAGHNERRRKPPAGSVSSSRFGRISSTVFDNSNRVGGIVLDFTAYSRLSGRDGWPTTRSSERVHGSQGTGMGRSITQPWQNSSQNPPTSIYLQGSAAGTGFSSSGIPSGECFTGVDVTDSTCALSLLSNQPWGSVNRTTGLEVNNLVNAGMVQSTAPHVSAVNQYPNSSWCFKGNEVSSSSLDPRPDLGLAHISQPLSNHFSSEVQLSQQNRRQYMELEHSRAYDSSTLHMHWSLR